MIRYMEELLRTLATAGTALVTLAAARAALALHWLARGDEAPVDR